MHFRGEDCSVKDELIMKSTECNISEIEGRQLDQ